MAQTPQALNPLRDHIHGSIETMDGSHGTPVQSPPRSPAVDYLVRLHADIGGRILDNQKQAQKLADDMKSVEAVIRMFDPAFHIAEIAPRRRVTGNAWFKRGSLFRHGLEALRKADKPLSARDILVGHARSEGRPERHGSSNTGPDERTDAFAHKQPWAHGRDGRGRVADAVAVVLSISGAWCRLWFVAAKIDFVNSFFCDTSLMSH